MKFSFFHLLLFTFEELYPNLEFGGLILLSLTVFKLFSFATLAN